MAREEGPKVARQTSWDKYLEALAGRRPATSIARFHATYSLAIGLSSVGIVGASARQEKAVLTMMRIMYAYTALEALEKALGQPDHIQVNNRELALMMQDPRARSLYKSVKVGIAENKSATNALARLMGGTSPTVRPIAHGLRNLMAHGTLNASRIDLRDSSFVRGIVDEVTLNVLQRADDRFLKYVRTL